jgi:RNA polymerase sigma factor (sigma-70 family)
MATAPMKNPLHPSQNHLIASLYQEHYAWLYAWLSKKIIPHDQVEDIAQDTFCKLLKLSQPPLIQHPKSYLAQTASRIMIDQARRRQIEQSYLEYLSAQQATHHHDSPENILVAIELLDRLAWMLDDLAEPMRQVFLLRYMDGLNQLQIAERLELSRRQVQLLLIKAIHHCDQIVLGN